MGKKYADYMDEISADDLYKGLLAFGLFSNRMPPVFSSTSFFDYCVKNHPTFSNSDHDYIRYKTLRNINVPRQLGIPVPMAYEKMFYMNPVLSLLDYSIYECTGINAITKKEYLGTFYFLIKGKSISNKSVIKYKNINSHVIRLNQYSEGNSR